MGRGEGRGCYCAVNHNLREVIDAIGDHYRYVVVDNEAGMEHLSRRTTRDVQHLLIVSDPTQRGIVAAGRIAGFRDELDINIENAHLIVNRLPGGEMPPASGGSRQAGCSIAGRPFPKHRHHRVRIQWSSARRDERRFPVYQAVATMLEKSCERCRAPRWGAGLLPENASRVFSGGCVESPLTHADSRCHHRRVRRATRFQRSRARSGRSGRSKSGGLRLSIRS